jgi:hypothetical protein
MYCYFVYGLGIHSELPLLGLHTSGEVADDVVLRRESLAWLREQLMNGESLDDFQLQVKIPPNHRFRSCFHDGMQKPVFRYFDEIGMFLLINGQEIIVDPVSLNLDQWKLSFFILKSILPELIHQRGQLLMLHANAVVMFGSAVVFMGKSGAGKSTTTAALCKLGHNLISDDVVVVDANHRQNYMVFPSFPQVLLWTESATFLGYDPKKWPQPYSQVDKHSFFLTDGFPKKPVKIKCIYLLNQGTSIKIEPLRAKEAFSALISSAYFNVWSNNKEISSLLFQQYVSLANSLPIRQLTRTCSICELPELIKLIEEDIEAQ